MNAKEPVLLTVLIETGKLRWFVAGIGLTGEAVPLVRSETGNLSPYVGAEFDEQVSFLRHRLSGVLQRGCDRLWGRRKRAMHIVFVADGSFTQAAPELTRRVAEHFVDWMTSPPSSSLPARVSRPATSRRSTGLPAGSTTSIASLFAPA